MAKNRRIPFGYQMINGEITTHPREVTSKGKVFWKYPKNFKLKTFLIIPVKIAVGISVNMLNGL